MISIIQFYILSSGLKYILPCLDTYIQTPKSYPLVFGVGIQFTQSCPTLCDPKNCSTPGVPVHHQLPEFTKTHVL